MCECLEHIRMIVNHSAIILKKLGKMYPDAKCALHYREEFELLVAVVFLWLLKIQDEWFMRLRLRRLARCPAEADREAHPMRIS